MADNNAPNWDDLTPAPPAWDDLKPAAPVPNVEKQVWASLNPQQRAQLLLSQLPGRMWEQNKEAVKSIGVRGGLTAGGQLAGAGAGAMIGGPPGAAIGSRLGGAAGGALGSMVDQFRTRGAVKSPGDVVGSTILGAITPGGGAASNALKFGAGGAASKAAQVVIDKKDLPTKQDLADIGKAGAMGLVGAGIMEAVPAPSTNLGGKEFSKTLAAADRLDYILPPSLVKPTAANNVVESLAGKADAALSAIKSNAGKTTNAIRDYYDLPEINPLKGKPEITEGDMALITAKANEPFAAVGAVSPKAKDLMRAYLDKANEKSLLERANYQNYTSERTAQIKEVKVERDDLFSKLETEIKSEVPAPEAKSLLDGIEKGRKMRAQAALVEAARNKGDGSIDGQIIGNAFDQSRPGKITDVFADIGRVQNTFSKVIKDASNSPAANVSKLAPYAGLTGAGAAMYAGRPDMAAAMLAAPFVVPRAAQAAIFNPKYQQFLRSQPMQANPLLNSAAQLGLQGQQLGERQDTPVVPIQESSSIPTQDVPKAVKRFLVPVQSPESKSDSTESSKESTTKRIRVKRDKDGQIEEYLIESVPSQ